jgi:ADP-heptose:LPS heptosyltransferase
VNSCQELPIGARLLIVLTGSLGDVARGLVVPTLLKDARPDLHITWLVEERWKEIVQLCPAVDESLVYHRRNKRWGIDRLIRDLHAAPSFHWALDLQRHFKSGVFTRLSGASRRVGFARKDAKEGNWLFQTEHIGECDMKRSKVYHYKAFVEHVLGETPEERTPRFEIAVESARDVLKRGLLERNLEAKEFFQELVRDECRLIVLALGSSWESKDWPPSGYAELIRHLLVHKDLRVALVGDSSQVPLGDKLQSISGKTVINLAGMTNLTELVGILSLSAVSAGPDTGVGHLASLIGTPYVSLFGPTDPARVAPFGSEELVLTSYVPCRPCGRRVCPGLKNACMRLIAPEDVATAVLGAMRGELAS